MNNPNGKYDVLIIGSGLGGLLCGYILAREGMSVCILEKNRRTGGCLQTFRRNGITFDTGVHYFGSMDPGQALHRYWCYFGLTGSLKLERMNPDGFDRIVMGKDEYPLAMGFDHFKETLEIFFPHEKEQLSDYIHSLEKIAKSFPMYNLTEHGRHEEDRYRSQSAYDFFRKLSDLSGNKISSKLAAVLAGNNFLYSGDPHSTPLHVAALINHSFISSAWRPVGGSDQISSYLISRIQSFGGEILNNREVEKIDPKENIFRTGTKSGELFFSEYLVSAISPQKTYGFLDPSRIRKATVQRIKGLKNTPGVFTVHVLLNEKSFRQLDHNYYIHRSGSVWKDEDPGTWPQSCMICTPPDEPQDQFAKSVIIMAMMDFSEVEKWTGTPSGDRGHEYNEFRDKKAELLLSFAEIKFPELRSCISGMTISTPLTWLDYTGTPDGSMYGIRKDYLHPLESTFLPRTRIPKMFLTGQSTNLHGVLGVTIGAVLTCGEIVGLDMLMKKIRND
jgi:all-trans-retinol 13,14-reductase